jgi:hypothetical protein
MRLNKWFNLSDGLEVSLEVRLERLSELLHTSSFWCSKPEDLNDPNEFIWEMDYSITNNTAPLLARLLTSHGYSRDEANLLAMKIIHQQQPYSIDKYIKPIADDAISKCRSDYRIACFATDTVDRELMWSRYGGSHCGVCIELELPDSLRNTHLHRVTYLDKKVLHIDRLLSALMKREKDLYEITFLTKNKLGPDTTGKLQDWSQESEIRAVIKPNIERFPAKIMGFYCGHKLPDSTNGRVLDLLQKYSIQKV